MSQNEKPAALEVLIDIRATLKVIVQLLQQRTSAPAKSEAVASDRDLDGKYGDPEVKFDPRDWSGDSCKGLHMSACPAEFLDLLAETFDYFAQKAEDAKEVTSSGKAVAPYKRADAARARGWAKRIRSGPTKASGRPDGGWAHSDDF